MNLYKYPRTYHFPFSEGATSDDKILKDVNIFSGKRIVITEKMDGENTSIYNGYFHARSLDSKMDWFQLLGITPVPVLYEGIFDEDVVRKIARETVSRGGEGIVVRLADAFDYDDFSKSVAKFVRKNHVQTGNHWTHTEIKKNNLKL